VKRACVALLALAASACASSTWASRRAVAGAPFVGRLLVPRVYAPLMPGSAYPNRRVETPARGRPGVVLVAPGRLVARASAPLAERGVVVLRLEDRSRVAEAAAWLARRPECAGARIGLELAGVEPRAADLANVAAAAILGSDAPPLGGPPPLFVARTIAAGAPPSPGPETGAVKLYRAPEGFDARDLVPEGAWRDAAEWLTETLAPR